MHPNNTRNVVVGLRDDIFCVTQSNKFKGSEAGESSPGLEMKDTWVLLHKPSNSPQILVLTKASYLPLLKPGVLREAQHLGKGL